MFSSVYADRGAGPYISVGYGVSTLDDNGFYNNLKKNDSYSTNVTFGAYINKYLSVEFNYTDSTAFGTSKAYEYDKGNLSFFALDVSTLAHYAFFDDILDFYAKFGVGEIHQDNKEIKGFTFVYGLGTSLRLNDTVSIKLAVDMFDYGYDANKDGSSDYDFNINYVYTALEFQFWDLIPFL